MIVSPKLSVWNRVVCGKELEAIVRMMRICVPYMNAVVLIPTQLLTDRVVSFWGRLFFGVVKHMLQRNLTERAMRPINRLPRVILLEYQGIVQRYATAQVPLTVLSVLGIAVQDVLVLVRAVLVSTSTPASVVI
jgi:hypothetical protein